MNVKRNVFFGIGLLAIFSALFGVGQLSNFEDATWLKLWVLLGVILLGSVGLTFTFHKSQFVLHISRIFSGILFIFSGFVKAVDPLGSKYKFIDYFEAWDMLFLEPTALTFGIILSTIELLVGLCLLFKILPKWSSILGLLFMLFFTPVTLYLAFQENISGKELVHDCGCFGDALVLTNWQTFVKNLLILIPVGFTFWFRKSILDFIPFKKSIVVLCVLTFLILGLSWFALEHLPPIDFRPYKKTTKLVCQVCEAEALQKDTKTYQYAEFVHAKTGEKKEFEITENWPEDTLWEYNSNKDVREEKIKLEVPQTNTTGKIFEIPPYFISLGSEDYTCTIIKDTNYVFLSIQYDLLTTDLDNQSPINLLYTWTQKQGFAMYGVTASDTEQIAIFTKKNKVPFTFLQADDISLKTIVRANPGLVLLKNGVVLDNWHGNDVPSPEEMNKLLTKYNIK